MRLVTRRMGTSLKKFNLIFTSFFVIFVIAVILGLLLIFGCSLEKSSGDIVIPEIDQSETSQNPTPTPFHYQLQGASFEDLLNLNAKYLVIDINDAQLTLAEINELKKSSVVLSYLSIGEAENYRDYWQEDWKVGSPPFIDEENPQWEGNYKVKYWDPEWQEIILTKVKEIKAQGYDGVYLDIIDAYGYYENKGVLDAKGKIIDFVERIKSEDGLLIFSQNAIELYNSEKYQSLIDGFGVEDTWYDDNVIQEADHTNEVLLYLRDARDDGKVILSIDYPLENVKVCDFYTKCNDEDFFCTVNNRNLDFSRPIRC